MVLETKSMFQNLNHFPGKLKTLGNDLWELIIRPHKVKIDPSFVRL